jgi:multidrug efflux pump subunit AcrA (membrane-fusion protein)
MSSEQSSVNSETIEQTKQQIRSLVSEISQLSKSDIAAEEYYAGFLQRVVQALAAVGGAIWLFSEGRRLQLTYQINLSETLLDSASEDASRHTRLLNYTAQTNEGHLIPPLSGASDERAGANPTRYLLVITPLRSDGQVEGLIEIFQRPDSPPATQKGYLRFLEQMTELAGEWLKTQKLRQFSDRHSLWAQADHFSRLVHESLNLRETAYAVANEGRRLIGCDRVSVAIMQGRKCVVESVSGQDTLENRSNIVHLLGKLATKVVATGDSLWYEGSTEDLPPQIEKSIEEYVDEAYTKSMVVLPLRKPKSPDETARESASGEVEREQNRAGEVIGALIVEQIESELPRAIIAPRMDLVYEHSTRALANSMDYSNLFLMPVWRTLGKAAWVVKARTLPKTLAITALILIILGTLTFVQKDFYLKAKGELQPEIKREVFVNVGGTVTNVSVEDQQMVEEGELLLELMNTDLEVQWEDIVGQQLSTQEQLNSAMDARARRENEMTEAEMVRIDGQIAELTKRLESLKRQKDLLEEKRGQLKIHSPISGQVMMSWEVERSLLNRTVETGQVLMSVADLTSDWEVQMFMPERRMGHIDNARREFDQPLEVSYILATQPKTEHIGVLEDVQRITQVHDDDGNTVRLRVGIDQSAIEDLRPGASVRGKVLCGRRAIGYTWFHEAVEWLQANVLF